MQVDKKEPGNDDPLNWRWLDFSNRKFMRMAGPKPPNLAYKITWDTPGKEAHSDQVQHSRLVGDLHLQPTRAR